MRTLHQKRVDQAKEHIKTHYLLGQKACIEQASYIYHLDLITSENIFFEVMRELKGKRQNKSSEKILFKGKARSFFRFEDKQLSINNKK